jgi:valyl-tRNA synthetase
MPFITEELWGKIPGRRGSIMVQPFPRGDGGGAEEGRSVELLVDLITRARNLRAEGGIAPSLPVDFALQPKSDEARRAFDLSADEFRLLARASSVEVVASPPEGEGWATATATGFGVFLRTPEKTVDRAAERRRLEAEVRKIVAERDKFAAKLSNPAFVDKAPPDVVAKNRLLLEEFEAKRAQLEVALAGLRDP